MTNEEQKRKDQFERKLEQVSKLPGVTNVTGVCSPKTGEFSVKVGTKTGEVNFGRKHLQES